MAQGNYPNPTPEQWDDITDAAATVDLTYATNLLWSMENTPVLETDMFYPQHQGGVGIEALNQSFARHAIPWRAIEIELPDEGNRLKKYIVLASRTR